MTLLKYGPFGDVDDMPGMRQMQETLSRFLTEPNSRPWTPAVDILETENDLVVKMDAPEVDLKDVDIRLENHTLTVKGERKFENREDRGATAVEYGLLVGLIAVAIILTVTALGGQLQDLFQSVTDALPVVGG